MRDYILILLGTITILVLILNNETGTITDEKERIAKKYNITLSI